MSRPSADARLRRILAAVPWVAAADGPQVSDVCRRFGYESAADLHADFELLTMCGIYPYTADALIEVDFDQGRVWVRYAPFFSRPLRLTPGQALALVASSAALLAHQGDSSDTPLARGLAKLALVLGIGEDEVVDVELGPAGSEVLATLQRAAADHRQVELDYYGYGRDSHSRRVVEPHVIYGASGQWYLAAFCHQAQDRRLFRIDRVTGARMLDKPFSSPPALERPPPYRAGPEDPTVTLELDAGARWVVEQYPVERVEEIGGGRQLVTLRASGRAWLERLLLRVGPSVAVDPEDVAVGRQAAAKVLARYRAGQQLGSKVAQDRG